MIHWDLKKIPSGDLYNSLLLKIVHVYRWLMRIYLLKRVIFHGYVKLPQGKFHTLEVWFHWTRFFTLTGVLMSLSLDKLNLSSWPPTFSSGWYEFKSFSTKPWDTLRFNSRSRSERLVVWPRDRRREGVGARRMWGSSQYGRSRHGILETWTSQFRLNHRMKHRETIETIEVIAGIYPV